MEDEEVLPRPGIWRAWLEAPGGELPFGLEIERNEGRWSATIVNGSERLPYHDLDVRDGGFLLHLDPYDSWIDATVMDDGARMLGTWTRKRGTGPRTEMIFRASFGRTDRFTQQAAKKSVNHQPIEGATAAEIPSAAGRWAVDFDSSDALSVGIFETTRNGGLSGTFLTTLGDYRFLEGRQIGKQIFLSCFDGAHAFLFRAEFESDGSLRGDFWSRDSWHETWTATPDNKAQLADDFALTEYRSDVSLGSLSFPDLDGVERALDDPAFRGRGRILVIFGSWCPNCGDSTDAMVRFHELYAAKGLSILGLAFEFEDKAERMRAVVQKYVDKKNVRYPVLIAGLADKAKASQAFPVLDRVRAYPTTVFLNADNTVRAVHTGFSGPATGQRHQRLMERFEDLIEAMLAGE
ncbi:MAG: thiol-disulfide isomerase/thioredoxin [Planctomycetota bacterium]|jgi:thiol-disulfide isomerase/thioredoxin